MGRHRAPFPEVPIAKESSTDDEVSGIGAGRGSWTQCAHGHLVGWPARGQASLIERRIGEALCREVIYEQCAKDTTEDTMCYGSVLCPLLDRL
jgi:hypothetical protein